MSTIVATEHPSATEVLFRLASPLPSDLCQTFHHRDEAQGVDMARALFLIMGVKKVQMTTHSIMLEKDAQALWPLIVPPAINIINSRVKQFGQEVA